MPSYMVLFDPLTHTEDNFNPPADVQGGVMGDTENGIMAVYSVPIESKRVFESSVMACDSAIRFQQVE